MVAKSFLLKEAEPKMFFINFLVKFFLVANSIPRKQIWTKNFLVENFYGFKIITSDIGSNQKFPSKNFGRKFFKVAKSFPRK